MLPVKFIQVIRALMVKSEEHTTRLAAVTSERDELSRHNKLLSSNLESHAHVIERLIELNAELMDTANSQAAKQQQQHNSQMLSGTDDGERQTPASASGTVANVHGSKHLVSCTTAAAANNDPTSMSGQPHWAGHMQHQQAATAMTELVAGSNGQPAPGSPGTPSSRRSQGKQAPPHHSAVSLSASTIQQSTLPNTPWIPPPAAAAAAAVQPPAQPNHQQTSSQFSKQPASHAPVIHNCQQSSLTDAFAAFLTDPDPPQRANAASLATVRNSKQQQLKRPGWWLPQAVQYVSSPDTVAQQDGTTAAHQEHKQFVSQD